MREAAASIGAFLQGEPHPRLDRDWVIALGDVGRHLAGYNQPWEILGFQAAPDPLSLGNGLSTGTVSVALRNHPPRGAQDQLVRTAMILA